MARPRLFVDTAAIRERPDFRALFTSQLLGVAASQLAGVAVAYQVYELTHSSLQVGAVSVTQLVPLIAGALLGGAMKDSPQNRWSRRRVLAGCAAVAALTSAGLAINAGSGHASVLAIYLLCVPAALVGGAGSAVANASVPALAGRERLVAAYSIMQLSDQVAMVAAPVLSGVLLSVAGASWTFSAVALVAMSSSAAAWRLSPAPGGVEAASTDSPQASRPASLLDGLRYVWRRQALEGAYLIDLAATVFGLPRALFPAVTATILHGGSVTLGLLYAAPGIGALVGAATTGWVERVRRRGLIVVGAVGVFGVAILVFGFSRVLWLSLVLLVVAGWADVVSAVLRSAILQGSVPEGMRARISSLQIAVVEGGPRLGDLEAGAVGAAVSTEFSIISGGVVCVVAAVLLAVVLPGFRREQARLGQDER